MPSSRALVTGAYGFVGRHVARCLAANGHFVVGMGHGNWSREDWRRWGISEWHSADITVETLTTYAGEPEVVVHCAGSGSVAFSMSHPLQDYQRSVSTTAALLEFLRLNRSGDARLVLPSSAGVYGVARSLPITVDAPLEPVSPYGVHKVMAESLCMSYARHFGLRCAIVRLFSVYGPGLRKQLPWDACSRISAGELLFAGTGNETRDWLHVEDAADLLRLAAGHAEETCPIVNGGVGLAVTNREVIDAFCSALRSPGRAVFSGRSRPGDPTDYMADVSGASSWGWKPRHAWQVNMAAYATWFQEGAQ